MRRITLSQIIHLFAGILILMHGFSSFEDSEFKLATGYFCIAIVSLLVAGLDKYVNKKFNRADVAFFLLESITLLYSAWDYKMEGKNSMFYIIAVFGILYIILSFATLIFSGNHKNHASSHRPRKRKKIKRSATS
jgi:hypothetical protein